MSAEQKYQTIGAEAKRLAERLNRNQAVRTGFGGEDALESAFWRMAIFAVGVAKDQDPEAVLKEACL